VPVPAAASEPLQGKYGDDQPQTAVVEYSTLIRYDETELDEHDLNTAARH